MSNHFKNWVIFSSHLILLVLFSGVERIAAQNASQPNHAIKRHADAVLRKDCFPIENLSSNLQELSRKMLLDALDSEALYTIAGDLKPVSEGFHGTYVQDEKTDKPKLQEIEKALSAWKCGDCFEVGILPFNRQFGGKRYVSTWIANKSSLAKKIETRKAYFTRMGLTKQMSTQTILVAIERSSNSEDRWRGFGTIFGYPEFAIEFFVRAGSHQATTGEFVERDFRNFPTHAHSRGGFVLRCSQTQSRIGIRKKSSLTCRCNFESVSSIAGPKSSRW